MMHACLDDRASKPASPVVVGDIHAPDARAVLLLRAGFPKDPRHRHESFRLFRIGDREHSTIWIREVRFNRRKLSESAVVWRCAKRAWLCAESFAPEGVEARRVLVCQTCCGPHVRHYLRRSIRPQLLQMVRIGLVVFRGGS